MAVGELRLITAADLRRLVPMADAIGLVRAAFIHLSRGEAEVPLRVPCTERRGASPSTCPPPCRRCARWGQRW